MPTMSVKFCAFRRWVTGAALAAAVAVPTAAFAQVVVIANGSPITAYDIEQRTKLIAISTHKAPTREEVIQELIDDLPFVSSSAFLQSIMPAPVRERSSATSLALIVAVIGSYAVSRCASPYMAVHRGNAADLLLHEGRRRNDNLTS